MRFIDSIIGFIFPSEIQEKDLIKIPPAPSLGESWIFSLYNYQHPRGKKLIYSIKKYNDRMLAQILATAMFEYVHDYIADQQQLHYFINPLIIPVPISKKRLSERGFNQTHLLAKYFAERCSGDYQNNIVQKENTSKKQALVENRNQRFINIKNTFKIDPKKMHLLKNKDVVIIDDLSTTGATLMELKKILEKNGIRNIIAVTLAH